MAIKRVFRENLLTGRPKRDALVPTVALAGLLVLGRACEIPASAELVFAKGEIWRAWTTLFVHADWAHLLSNLVLFVPFAYALMSYFGLGFFPLAGFAVGGLVNLAVLRTMPPETLLVGVSGVVYWMGAAWVTLGFLVDRRRKTSIRAVKALGVSLILFAPELYRPEVSYLSHLLGYVSGVACAFAYYLARRPEFRSAEKYDLAYDFDAHWDPRINAYSEELPEDLPAVNGTPFH
jgi:rhomboid protease GluP